MANEFSRLNGWLRRQFGLAGADPSPWLDLTTYTGSFPPGVGTPTPVAGTEPLTSGELIAASLPDMPGQSILFDDEIYHQIAAGQNVAANWEKGTADLASEVIFTPNGDIGATDVQSAIVEVRDDRDTQHNAHLTDAVAAHASTAISFTPAGDIAATDVQAAVVEVDAEHVAKAATPVANNLLAMDANGDGVDADVGVATGDAMLNKAKAATDTFSDNDFGIVNDATYGAQIVYHDGATVRQVPFVTAGLRRNVVTKAATGNIALTEDAVLATGGAGGITLTLPTAVGISGAVFDIVKVDAGVGAVTVDGNGAETINGAATYLLPNQWDSVTVMSDGTNWVVL